MKDLVKISACRRHAKYIEQCPRCNIEARAEEHASGQVVYVTRKKFSYKGKEYK